MNKAVDMTRNVMPVQNSENSDLTEGRDQNKPMW